MVKRGASHRSPARPKQQHQGGGRGPGRGAADHGCAARQRPGAGRSPRGMRGGRSSSSQHHSVFVPCRSRPALRSASAYGGLDTAQPGLHANDQCRNNTRHLPTDNLCYPNSLPRLLQFIVIIRPTACRGLLRCQKTYQHVRLFHRAELTSDECRPGQWPTGISMAKCRYSGVSEARE